MSSSDALWLTIWEIIATVGFVIVIIGVVIEGVEHFKKFPRKEHARKVQIEKLGWFLVVVGLAMEFLGDHAAKRIADRETGRLKQQAADATKLSAESNERSLGLQLTIEELREANNEMAEYFSPMQIGELISFTSDLHQVSGVSVILANNANDERAQSTTSELRGAFNVAGWRVVNPSEVNEYAKGIAIKLSTDPSNNAHISSRAANVLLDALIARNLPAFISPLTNGVGLPTNTLRVVVGERPNPRTSKSMVWQARKRKALAALELFAREYPNPTPIQKEEGIRLAKAYETLFLMGIKQTADSANLSLRGTNGENDVWQPNGILKMSNGIPVSFLFMSNGIPTSQMVFSNWSKIESFLRTNSN